MTIRHFIVVQSFSHVWLFATPWTAACQVSLSFTISWSLLKFMSIELVMSPNHFILCHLLLFLPSIFPSIRVFSNEMALHIRWPKYWRFSFSISSSNDYSGLISFRIDWFHRFMANRWENNGNSDRLYFLMLQITVDDDCNREIRRCLFLGRKAMTNLDNKLKTETLFCQQRSI